jgi:hypothetical protein
VLKQAADFLTNEDFSQPWLWVFGPLGLGVWDLGFLANGYSSS